MFFRPRNTLFLVTALLLLISGAQTLGQEMRLELKFQEGDMLHFKVIERSTQEMMGMKSISEQVQYMEQKVVKVEEGVATLETQFTRITINAESPMGNRAFDSDQEGATQDMSMAAFSLQLNRKFIIKMSQSGKVLAIEGFSAIGKDVVAKLREQSAGAPPNPQMERGLAMMENKLTDAFMTKEIGQIYAVFPAENVAANTEWTQSNTIELQSLFPLVTEEKYVVESIENGVARVTMSGTLEKKAMEETAEEGAEEDPMAQMMAMMQITEGKTEGMIEFDSGKGLITKIERTRSMAMEMQGQKVPLTLTQAIEWIDPAQVKTKPVEKTKPAEKIEPAEEVEKAEDADK